MNEIQTYIPLATLIFSALSLLAAFATWRLISRQANLQKEMGLVGLLAIRTALIGGRVTWSRDADSERVGEVSDIRLAPRGGGDTMLVISFAWYVTRTASNALTNFRHEKCFDIEILWPEDALVLDRCKMDDLRRVIVVPRGVQGLLVFDLKGCDGLSREDAARLAS